MIDFGNDWNELLKEELQKDYYQKLRVFLADEYRRYTVYPDMYDIFNAYKYTSYSDVKVVILGQDPYHNPNQAHGLAFSVKKGVDIPPSLKNIYKELHDEIGFQIPSHGYLVDWTKQGVFLLNTVLTVRAPTANSHAGKGWEQFTDETIKLINQKDAPVVYLLWGANARSKAKLITNPKHLVLQSPHPSPLSAFNGFFGNGHFKKANDFLNKYGLNVDWTIN
ncbi:MAG: uracil-DNA glycosylase [Clostridia bacterium]|nr:uracil-DNA glycosylase [Clostridia bacterium]